MSVPVFVRWHVKSWHADDPDNSVLWQHTMWTGDGFVGFVQSWIATLATGLTTSLSAPPLLLTDLHDTRRPSFLAAVLSA
jgi:hypothetical protein